MGDEKEEQETYQCPCCLKMQPGDGFYDICGNCSWECDGWGLDEEGGPNHMTLREGRANYAKYGTSDEHCQHGVRAQGCLDCVTAALSDEECEDRAEELGY